MKTSGKIMCKIMLLIAFLWITPFFSSIREIMQNSGFLDAFVYHQHTFDESISIKDQMNLLSYHADFTIDDELKFQTTQDNEQTKTNEEDDASTMPKTPDETVPDTGKTVYIYSTHQMEAYAGGETVMDAAAILGNALEEKGIHVVVETADFNAYLKSQDLDYNHSYQASYVYLNEALVNYNGFDLIIDLHRDAIPREASYIEVDGIRYAKMMPVIGGLTDNADTIKNEASTLSDIIDGKVHGIMRSTMVREAYYNQQVSDRMMLLECGGDVNSFDEVRNSMQVLADGIYDYLMR